MSSRAIALVVAGGLAALNALAAPPLSAESAVSYGDRNALSDEDLDLLRGREDISTTTTSTATADAATGGTATSNSNSFNETTNLTADQDLTATNQSTFTGDGATTGHAYVGDAMAGMSGFANILVNSGINSNLQGTIGVTIHLQ